MEERVEAHFVEYYAPLDLWTEVDALPASDGGIDVFFRDVSERMRAENRREELLQRELAARQLAESASRTKDEFLAMLGHELRNPLAPILTALELMRLRNSAEFQKERGIIERQVTHLLRLVDDLLDVSRITRGNVELARQLVEVAEIVAKAIELAAPLLESGRHRLVANVATRGLLVDADSGRLAQVFGNLLTNAAKYTPPGGEIVLSATLESDEVVISVRDTGVGIPPDLLPKVFDLFVQNRQTLDRSQGGLGIGLAIVRSLVILHGGTVTAQSEGAGRGSTFIVRLPSAGAAAARLESPAPGPGLLPQVNQRRVLIVDDNEDAAEMLADGLSMLGYLTRTAHDGPSALGMLHEFRPDVALLDIGLPVMDGYELARAMRERPELADMRLVAITGYGQESDRQLALRAGFDHHMTKPVDFSKLTTWLAAERPGAC